MTDESTAASKHSMIRVEDVTREYPDGDVLALDGVTLDIGAGEYVAIMGPSGSGKSTLLSLMGALDKPTSGRVLIDGRAVDEWPSLDELRSQKIGFVFQSFYLLPTLTALENVQIPMFGCGLSSPQRVERAKELLEAVGMSDRSQHLPSQLSVGQRQRVAIARSLSNNPPLLLADEPTGNLDSQTETEVLSLFAKLHEQRDLTLVVVTHSDEVAANAKRVVRVRDGRIASDTKAEDQAVTK